MKWEVLKDEAAVSARAEEFLLESLVSSEVGAIALPTGKTPVALYQRLNLLSEDLKAQFRTQTWFALDEFLRRDLAPESSFRGFLLRHFIHPMGIPEGNLLTLSFHPDDPEKEATRYESAIAAAGGLKLALLGIGLNGHIGFNEPGTPLDSRTGVRRLTEKSRKANAYLFPSLEETAHEAMTMGISTILSARRVLMLATGASKEAPVSRLVKDRSITETFPASALWSHPDSWLLVDSTAGAAL